MTLKLIRIPPKDEKLAELVGIILGDGNIHHCITDKTNSYVLRIVGDSNKDKEYLINYVKPLVDSLFDVESKVYKHNKFNALYINVCSRLIVEFLCSIGMKAGNKIKNKLTIPDWIKSNSDLLKACIRGLMDTDGSVYELLPHWPGLSL